MSALKFRWSNDPQYLFILNSLMNPNLQPSGQTWQEWNASAPKAPHPTFGELLDCREVIIEKYSFGESDFSVVLDDSKLTDCTFNRTIFANASSARSDFSRSRFIDAQMSPIYSKGAIYKDCVFESCFLMGIGSDHSKLGAFSDLTDCDLTGVLACNTGFDRCDFAGSKLSDARFIKCDFTDADMRGADLTGAVFEECDFSGAHFDDFQSIRKSVKAGANKGLEAIRWVSAGVLAGT